MTDELKTYYDDTQKPWGKLFYKIIWEQLSFAQSMKVLDFGSGFGITTAYLASKNDVTAIEPNKIMCEKGIKNEDYKLIIGGLNELAGFANETFDLIICHNVLEYIDNKDDYIAEFCRLLKVGGRLSLIKHNRMGRVFHKVAFENNLSEALQVINGEAVSAKCFGEIKYYDKDDLAKWSENYGLKHIDSFGIRTFFALHSDNTVRFGDEWFDYMYELEVKASSVGEFRDVAFYNHVILEKCMF